MNVKTTFLNGYSEEDIHMQEVEGYICKNLRCDLQIEYANICKTSFKKLEYSF